MHMQQEKLEQAREGIKNQLVHLKIGIAASMRQLQQGTISDTMSDNHDVRFEYGSENFRYYARVRKGQNRG